uniref:Uncharacterized protein MANES_18G141500 n=1 Tax=Rhizophora mucronata TaxID=61149 RepID=A0A2P2JGM1_RHIMU
MVHWFWDMPMVTPIMTE